MFSPATFNPYFDDEWGAEDLAIIDALEANALKRSRSTMSSKPNEKEHQPRWIGGSSAASDSQQ
eukprot:889864-Pyramimonas_sp.AAC.1